MLHEIARHRAVFGKSVRRSLQEIEDAEFKELETDVSACAEKSA